MNRTRREVLAGMGMATLAAGASPLVEKANAVAGGEGSCPFRLSVINDEITQDFERACQIAAHDFGLHWIELRGMWNKNITELNEKEIAESKKILAAHKLRVTDIASPLFKTDWPGAPYKHARKAEFHADFDAAEQQRLLDHCIALAKTFNTRRIRCFDFTRIEDQKPYRKAMNAKLGEAAETCAKHNLILILENEMTCNTATGAEAAAVLAAIPNRNFMLNWDPGNAAAIGATPYPNGYDLLPKDRIGHCHCKDVVRKADGKYAWAPVGGGIIDWVGQFRAFKRDGYHYAVSLETHWRGAGTPEASTRISMAGLKKTLAKAGISC
ncbi:MAG: sugar phosphate isomerase/epimerase family protein [Acidobacteriaceae bacterium]